MSDLNPKQISEWRSGFINGYYETQRGFSTTTNEDIRNYLDAKKASEFYRDGYTEGKIQGARSEIDEIKSEEQIQEWRNGFNDGRDDSRQGIVTTYEAIQNFFEAKNASESYRTGYLQGYSEGADTEKNFIYSSKREIPDELLQMTFTNPFTPLKI